MLRFIFYWIKVNVVNIYFVVCDYIGKIVFWRIMGVVFWFFFGVLELWICGLFNIYFLICFVVYCVVFWIWKFFLVEFKLLKCFVFLLVFWDMGYWCYWFIGWIWWRGKCSWCCNLSFWSYYVDGIWSVRVCFYLFFWFFLRFFVFL